LQRQVKVEREGRIVAQKLYRELVQRVASGDAVIDLESELQTLRDLSSKGDNGSEDS